MPTINTQPATYLQQLDSLRLEANDSKTDAEAKLRKAIKLLYERKEYVKRSIDVQIGFCIEQAKNKPYKIFVEWFDHALQCRVVLLQINSMFVSAPTFAFQKKHPYVQHFRPTKNLLDGMVTLRQAMSATNNSLFSILQMLNASGYSISDQMSLSHLHTYFISSPDFQEVANEK